MKNTFLALGLSLFALTAQATCKLEKPIDLKGLDLKDRAEAFLNVESTPALQEVVGPFPEDINSPVVLRLTMPSYGIDEKKQYVIGARLQYGNSSVWIGAANNILNGALLRYVDQNQNGSTHIVKWLFDGYQFGGEINVMSEVTVKDGKIISIVISDGQISNLRDYELVSVCVTKAER